MTKDSTDAYAAGLIDGEGCVYIAKKGGGYQLRLQIAMTTKARKTLEWMQKSYGGRLNNLPRSNKKWDAEVLWKVNGAEAATALQRAFPFLQVKKRQAEIGLRIESIRRSLMPDGGKQAKWTSEARGVCETLRIAIQNLNRKGPQMAALGLNDEFPMATPLVHLVGDRWCTYQRSLTSDTGWEPFCNPWPNSGMGAHGEFWIHNSSEFPSGAAVCSLSDILETCDVPQKFFLSATACRGILRRAEKRGRTLPGRLHEALLAAATDTTPTERTS